MTALSNDIRAALRTLLLIVQDADNAAREQAPDSTRALVISFIVAAAAQVLERLCLPLLDPDNTLELYVPGPGGFVADMTENALIWLTWIAISWLFARLWGRGAHLRRYIIAGNWLGALSIVLLDLPVLLLMRASTSAAMLAMFIALGLMLVLFTRLTRILLEISTARAVIVVLATFAGVILLGVAAVATGLV